MSKGSYIAGLRKHAGLTQQELAEKLGLKPSYGQKKISQWEADIGEPSANEIEKLAEVLNVSHEEILLILGSRSSQSALELFTRLASAECPNLLAVCYSGQPRISLDSAIRAKYQEALRKNLFLAMFVPFPTYPADSASSAELLLASHYNRVWGSVLLLRNELRRAVDVATFDQHVAIYGPTAELTAQRLIVPPFHSRYSLVIEKEQATGNYKKSLYLALETAESKYLQLIGTSQEESVYEQIQNWEAYFGEVLNTWIQNGVLPSGDCGYWRSREK